MIATAISAVGDGDHVLMWMKRTRGRAACIENSKVLGWGCQRDTCGCESK